MPKIKPHSETLKDLFEKEAVLYTSIRAIQPPSERFNHQSYNEWLDTIEAIHTEVKKPDPEPSSRSDDPHWPSDQPLTFQERSRRLINKVWNRVAEKRLYESPLSLSYKGEERP